ncbi:peptidoglycan-binding protein [Kribbella pittospori]|uniref:Peptidoglycan-binding protein n=1 Tax=Kribbella pittospori TaxID=722689 RepID=A0A4R0KTH4_9ACTN|nr:peptidoglycan-binding domain-containing protein [Kribbella pittospori]TCC64221.1 peptidoglycan-binding protein [Kribbella pittospori]
MPSTTAAGRPKAWIIATVAASCVAVAGIATAAVIGFQGPAQASAATPPASSSSSGQYQPGSGGHGLTPANTPATPVVVPSVAVKLLQQQLAQLNYYNGSITGYENAQTINAITYLQRDAHLPQTGQLNNATRAALNSMLVHGNNQMAGN